MLHVEGTRVHYELARKYIWPNMVREIKIICKACETCEKGKVRRQNLSAEFEQADKETRMTFLYPDRPTPLTFTVMPKAKS